MQPRSLGIAVADPHHPDAISGDLKQLKLKQFLASQVLSPKGSADALSTVSSSADFKPAALESLKPALKNILSSLITENSSFNAWSNAALQFDATSGKAVSSSSLDKLNEESARALDLGTRLAVSSNNERRLQNQLAATIAEIAELRSNSRQSSDLSLARENQELRLQLAAAQRARSQSASQLEHHLQSKCASLESENEVLLSKCRRLQQEIQRLNETSLPANFWEGQHSALNAMFDLKKEYEELLSAHMNVRSDVKLLVEEKNTLLAQLSNKEYECATMSSDLKANKMKISRLEFELRSKMSESFQVNSPSCVVGAVAGSPQLEAFVPTNRHAVDISSASPWASVSPHLSISRADLPFRTMSTSPAQLTQADHHPTDGESSQIVPVRGAVSGASESPSQVGDVADDLPQNYHDSQAHSQRMKAVLDLVTTLDSRLLNLDAMAKQIGVKSRHQTYVSAFENDPGFC